MTRDAGYFEHIRALAEAAPEAPREAVDLARRSLGPGLRAQLRAAQAAQQAAAGEDPQKAAADTS
jgi:hypothetical protein